MKPFYSNCLVYAFVQWIKEGGYICIRCSKSFKPLIHFLHRSKDGKITHFQPVTAVDGWRVMLFKFWFKGYVAEGDILR